MTEATFHDPFNDPHVLAHIGVLRKSGRYPWGSGENPHQHNRSFLEAVAELKKQGLTPVQIAEGFGMTTTEFRKINAIARAEQRASDSSEALRLKEKGLSNVAIGKEMGINESSVRQLLNPAAQERNMVIKVTADTLREKVSPDSYLDIGLGVEAHLGISKEKLATAVALLQSEGYEVHTFKQPTNIAGNYTEMKVLTPPGTTFKDVVGDKLKIKQINAYSEDGGESFEPVKPPRSISSKRVGITWAEDGGTAADGVIYVRPGVDDVSLRGARYAQVRIAVDGTHYLKGMAMYKDDLPDGVDLQFNTNKSRSANKLDAMKGLKDDETAPFGATVRQMEYLDSKGKKQQSVMNIVNEEGDWDRWSHNLSSQMLSKQPTSLAKQQLDLSLKMKEQEYAEIMQLTNPTVRKKLLEAFSDGADADAVHLHAAGLPRTVARVILPIPGMKETEVYSPSHRDGEKVVLIRHPHGGTFEIPELTVNNRNPGAKKALGAAIDAIGINAKVAERLSGADFDGDTVLVIPNNARKVKTTAPLAALKDFDPKVSYPKYDGMPKMSARTKGKEMGDISNLITDMTIQGASHSEIARAVKHSMVVIDAEKHDLNYKQSALDQGIKQLKIKYQARPDGTAGGASTLISRASSEARVNARKARAAKEGGLIDKATGKLHYVDTGETYVDAKGKTVVRTIKSTKLAETDDAFTLVSKDGGTPMERIYATHANQLKALANTARKSMVNTPNLRYSPSAKVAYKSEVDSLNAKLNVALKAAPAERRAQLIAASIVKQKTLADPNMDRDSLKRVKSQALAVARARTKAGKTRIDITQSEWDAIQAGAITNNKLSDILKNADLDQVKRLATPRTATVATPAAMARAKAMLAAGYTQSEIADALGVATSTLKSAFDREESS